MDSVVYSLLDSLDSGNDSELYEIEISENILDYSSLPIFYQIPLSNMISILSHSNSNISFDTANKILFVYSNKYGKDALDLIKVIKIEHLSFQQILSLLGNIQDCPIIEELKVFIPNNKENNKDGENPFMSLVDTQQITLLPDEDDDPTSFLNIFEASEKGNIEIIKKLIEKDPNNISTRDKQVSFFNLFF